MPQFFRIAPPYFPRQPLIFATAMQEDRHTAFKYPIGVSPQLLDENDES